MVSYAQTGEDVVLHRVLGGQETGFYVDVGACHPCLDSVTLHFYQRGWRGINIEPDRELYRNLTPARPRDINLHVAVGLQAGRARFYPTGTRGHGTVHQDLAAHRAEGRPPETVPTIPLRDIISCYGPDDGQIDFLKIDVEGAEAEVIASADWSRHRPRVVLVESVNDEGEPSHTAWEPALLAAGYRFCLFDGLNRFYCREEEGDCFQARLAAPANPFDNWVRAREAEACQQAARLPEAWAQIEAVTSERDKLRADLTATRDELEAARTELEAGRTERNRLEVALEGAENRAVDAARQLRQSRSEVAALERWAQQCARQLEQRQALLEAVYRSRSWRLTAPMQAALAALGRAQAEPAFQDPVRLEPFLLPRPKKPTLFIECTHTFHSDLNTGIQRVVRNILRHAPAVAARLGYDVVPVILDQGRFTSVELGQVLVDKMSSAALDSKRTAESRGDSPPSSRPAQKVWRLFLRVLSAALPFALVRRFLFAPPERFGFAWCLMLPLRAAGFRRQVPQPVPAPGSATPLVLDQFVTCQDSILLLLDSSWTVPIWPAVQRFKARGGNVVGVIYDLIPVTHSHTTMPDLTFAFRAWLREHFRRSDALIAISQCSARELQRFGNEVPRASHSELPPKIGHFHLGSELDFITDGSDARPEIKRIFENERHVFLIVGTFEPRKGHSYALDAFDQFWHRGGSAALVMVGRQAWKTEALLERAANHPRYNSELFLIRDATDSDLDYCYRHASALVVPSEVEGFGLPIVEAFQRGLPVLCSDIPVFREIADKRASFFGLSDSGELAQLLQEFCRTHDPARPGERSPQSWMGWEESVTQLFCAITAALRGDSSTQAGAAA